MKRKFLSALLILVILLTSTGPIYSGSGIKSNKFGPIVIQGHPWGESNYYTNHPFNYKPGSGSNSWNIIGAPTFTNFTLQFYYNYVVKKTLNAQSLVRENGRSE